MRYDLELQFETCTEEENSLSSVKLSEILPMVLDHLQKGIKNIDTKYPWSVKSNVV